MRDAEDVGAVALDALGDVAHRRRHRLDAPRVEIGPYGTRADDVVALGGEPALDRLVGRVAEREHDPVGIGAGRLGRHRDAARHAVGGGCRLDLQAVAAAVVELAQRRDLDALLVGIDDDRLQGQRRGRAARRACARTAQARRAPPCGAERRASNRLPCPSASCGGDLRGVERLAHVVGEATRAARGPPTRR